MARGGFHFPAATEKEVTRPLGSALDRDQPAGGFSPRPWQLVADLGAVGEGDDVAGKVG